MRLAFFLIILAYTSTLTKAHDVPIALFHITQSEAVIRIDISFDLVDFSQSIAVDHQDFELEIVQAYVDENTHFEFNNQAAVLRITTVEIIGDHIKIKGHFLGLVEDPITSMKMSNTCLNNISSHSNIIQVDLNDTSRDYRMHKQRTVINLQY